MAPEASRERQEGQKPIRVFLADDHPVVRQGLRAFLESRGGFEVVGEAGDSETTIADVTRLVPDVVLMDLVMPGAGGVAATREIRERSPSTRVLVLTSFASDDQVIPAVHAGAAGYVLKDIEPSSLEAAIRVVHRGEALLDPQVAQRVMDEVAHPSAGAGLSTLTPRELEVLRLLARGLSNRQLADELVVSVKTVKTHVSNILMKLGVRDRTQAALLAVREGLTDST
jgi:NarL family two-component system response regulator LiaR